MDELTGFLVKTWDSFNDLGIFNKTLVSAFVGYTLINVTRSCLSFIFKQTLLRQRLADNPKDPKYDPKKIYLHIYPRSMGKNIPNLSPFAMKVETWMRMNGISYEVVETAKRSRTTQQIPYIFHNGIEIADSDFVIDYLETYMKMDPNEGLDKEALSISRAFSKVVEESTFGSYMTHRFCLKFEEFRREFQLPVKPKMLETYLITSESEAVLGRMSARGIGRKAPSEVYKIGNEDIKAISDYLGNKQFMFGDKMTKVDCAIFGQLSQIVFVNLQYPFKDFINKECPNIMPYMDRIKGHCWKDWNQIVSHGLFQ